MGARKGDTRGVRERSLSARVSPFPVSTFSCTHYFQVPAATQATDVHMLDSAIHRINHYQQISFMEINYAFHWIVIYPEDRAIQPYNNQGLMNMDWVDGDKGYIQSRVFQGSWPNIALLRGWGFSFFYS